MRLLLADDHALIRQGLRVLAEKIEGVTVVAEVGDGLQAIQKARVSQPDVILMDIAMPGMNGLEAVIRLRRELPHVKILMLSMHAAEEYFRQALEAGASGYLLKDADRIELELALRAVSRGDTYLTPEVAKYAVQAYQSRGEHGTGLLGRLTSRQREVMQLVAEGKTTKEIAQRLDLSPRTVETHRAELMDRLNIHDLPGLIKVALQEGLITQTIT